MASWSGRRVGDLDLVSLCCACLLVVRYMCLFYDMVDHFLSSIFCCF